MLDLIRFDIETPSVMITIRNMQQLHAHSTCQADL